MRFRGTRIAMIGDRDSLNHLLPSKGGCRSIDVGSLMLRDNGCAGNRAGAKRDARRLNREQKDERGRQHDSVGNDRKPIGAATQPRTKETLAVRYGHKTKPAIHILPGAALSMLRGAAEVVPYQHRRPGVSRNG